MSDFKHVEEQIAWVRNESFMNPTKAIEIADTRQALLDVAKIGNRIDKEAEPNHPWEAVELLRDALAKLQEQNDG